MKAIFTSAGGSSVPSFSSTSSPDQFKKKKNYMITLFHQQSSFFCLLFSRVLCAVVPPSALTSPAAICPYIAASHSKNTVTMSPQSMENSKASFSIVGYSWKAAKGESKCWCPCRVSNSQSKLSGWTSSEIKAFAKTENYAEKKANLIFDKVRELLLLLKLIHVLRLNLVKIY